MPGRRVVITGVGVVSPIGIGVAEYRRSLLACRSAIGPRTTFDQTWVKGPENHLAAEIAAVPARPDLDTLDRFSRFAVLAAEEAVRDASEVLLDVHRERAAVVIGTAVGGDQSRDAGSHRIYKAGRRPHPMTIVRTMVNAAVSAVTIRFGLHGPAFNISTACASSAHAIGEAARMIRFGLTDLAIAGGAESLPAYSLFRAWQVMGVLSPDGCRPFAADRNGIVLGEGAGVLVLEPLEEAVRRGATIYAEIAGFGMSADAGDWVAPRPDGMRRSMEEALRDADLPAEAIGYVNAHGTGTGIGDAAEAEATARLFGGRKVAISSTKALHGHALGAGGALEVIATILGMREGWVPAMPAAAADPALPLDLVRGEPAPLAGDAAMSNSFAFGGLNASLVLLRARSDSPRE
ncbi:MAG: beta-ketoacyl-[acyl-carrier-protein] synthase family protein [Acidobacteriota bacterium]|nr:beta-ketoacyl-[acyl-carrier-protein] synthase family protein [Acidobacteriota bacterium]